MRLEEETRYPKTYNLYKRFQNVKETKGALDRSKLGMPEFAAIDDWHVTEKIDGTNIRVILRWVTQSSLAAGGAWQVDFFSRRGTDQNITQSGAKKFLRDTFTLENIFEAIDSEKLEKDTKVVFYGEMYGPGIQKGGGNYSSSIEYALFDVTIGHWWLEPDTVQDIASKIGVNYPPVLWEHATRRDIIDLVSAYAPSYISDDHDMEGVVARANPMMLFRGSHSPIKFKLKFEDMEKTKEWEESQ